MIIQCVDSELLLIAQDDHAALAARIMTAWRLDSVTERSTRARVLEATRQHDLGWQPVDAAPNVSAETGMPYDFLNAPVEVRQGVWPRAIQQLASQDAYVAALVAHHALTVYRRLASTRGWEEFFVEIKKMRDQVLATQDLGLDVLLRDYAIVGMGDLWSLVFCNGWREEHSMEGFRAVLYRGVLAGAASDAGTVDGGWLEITPDPFGGAMVPLEIRARRIPARPYSSDADLHQTLAHAPTVLLKGTAAGRQP